MHEDPIALFTAWLDDARDPRDTMSTRCALATASKDGVPNVRMVLLKRHGPDGFVVFTNLDSQKGKEIDENPRAALLFHWHERGRQVRIQGPTARVADDEADAYWASRPRESRLAAWASDQSRPLASRAALLARYDDAARRFPDDVVPRPARWTGVRVIAERIELWEQGEHRLHHRRLFERVDDAWRESLLFP